MLETLEITESEFLSMTTKDIKERLKVNMRNAELISNLIVEIVINRQEFENIDDSIKQNISNKFEENF